MSNWIGVIGTNFSRDRFNEGKDIWFCLPRSVEIGDQILLYQTRRISGRFAGFFAQARVCDIDPSRDVMCKKYGMSQGYLVWVDLSELELLPRVVALEELRQQPHLRNLGVVRRNAQATYFSIGKIEFEEIVQLAKA